MAEDARTILSYLKNPNSRYGAHTWQSVNGEVKVQWLPDEGRGWIDIENPKGVKGASGFRKLMRSTLPKLDVISEIPAKWEWNPDDIKKGGIYEYLGPKMKGSFKANPNMPNKASVWDTRPKSKGSIMSVKKAVKPSGGLGAARYSKEGAQLKEKARKLLQGFIDEVSAKKKAGLKVKGNEPKMALRAIRSILLSPDSVYGDTLEQALSEGWSAEKLKNKVRSMMEAQTHKRLALTPTDTLHHLVSYGSVGPSAQIAQPNALRQALISLTDEGVDFGEAGLRSLGETAHTGDFGKRLSDDLRIIQQPGDRLISAHAGDTTGRVYQIPESAGKSTDDLINAWWKSGNIPNQLLDAEIAQQVDAPRTDELKRIAKEFKLDINKPDEVQRFLAQNPQQQLRLSESVRTPTPDTVPAFTKKIQKGEYLTQPLRKGLKIGKYARYGLPLGGLAISSILATGAQAKAREKPTFRNKALAAGRTLEAGLDTIAAGSAVTGIGLPVAALAEVGSLGVGIGTDIYEAWSAGHFKTQKIRGRYGAKKALTNNQLMRSVIGVEPPEMEP